MGKNILGIFDDNDLEGVSALIDKLEESSFDYLKLEGDGVSLIIGKNGAGEATAVTSSVAAVPSAATQTTTATVPVAAPAQTTLMPAEAPVTSAVLLGVDAAGAPALAAASTASSVAAAAGAPAQSETALSLASTGAAAANTDVSTATQLKSSVPEQEGIITIKSPSYGLFYSQSEPGAPPYVTVGAVINKDDTIDRKSTRLNSSH